MFNHFSFNLNRFQYLRPFFEICLQPNEISKQDMGTKSNDNVATIVRLNLWTDNWSKGDSSNGTLLQIFIWSNLFLRIMRGLQMENNIYLINVRFA